MGGRKRGRETINVWLPFTRPPTGDLACNPGMCPRLGIELAAFWSAGWHSVAQCGWEGRRSSLPTEPQQPGPAKDVFNQCFYKMEF